MRSFPVLLAAALSLGACGRAEPSGATANAAAQADEAATSRLRQACGSPATFARLKELAFDDAARLRGDAARALDRVATQTTAQLDGPTLVSGDPRLGLATCSGLFTLTLPAESTAGADRRLAAQVEFAAQVAPDGSGLVYDMDGAGPIVERLALIGGPPAEPRPERESRLDAAARRTVAGGGDPARPGGGPGFDCRYARHRSEVLVCGNATLANLDRQMAALYYARMTDADARTRRALRRTRDAFLERRERCDRAICVASVYEDRINEINQLTRTR